ncbi:MAG TPA: Ig-like domain-containing protein [Gemmatimonadaceae bacterium]|nr:Ig-like domain-containing protein [Gemmatimonadaceae bacterium]
MERLSGRRVLAAAGCVAVATLLVVCSDDPVQPLPAETSLDTGMVLSNPVGMHVSAFRAAASASAAGSSAPVYVSLPAGTSLDAVRAQVSRLGDEVVQTVSMRDGGFDPVQVDAVPGDTVVITGRSASGLVVFNRKEAVRSAKPPRVVRTWPPRTKPDIPLNLSLGVVMSEPLQPSSVHDGSLRLVGSHGQVAGSVRVLPGNGTVLVFSPKSQLPANDQYRLVVDGSITDLDGEPLGEGVVLAFTTSNELAGDPAIVIVQPDTLYVLAGSSHQAVARVYDENFVHLLVDAPVSWSMVTSSADVTISETGLITAAASLALPAEVIAKAASGQSTHEFLIRAVPVPASLEVVPSAVTLAALDTLVVDVIARNAGGDRLRVPLSISSPDPAVASLVTLSDWGVAFSRRTLAAVSLGTTHITVSVGPRSAGLDVTVTPAREVASVRVSPAADNLVPNATGQLRAWLRDASGRDVIPTGPFSWSSSNTAVATVSGDGVVTAVGLGTATISGSYQGIVGSAVIDVTAAPTPPLFQSIATSTARTCGVTPAHDTYCWGSAPLGDPDPTRGSNRPLLVVGNWDAERITGGGALDGLGGVMCARTESLHTYCLAPYTIEGQSPMLYGRYYEPQPTIMFTHIGIGDGFLCGLTDGGVAYCWGVNDHGELGDGTTTSHTDALRVSGKLAFSSLTAGGDHACGLTSAGQAYCWGGNTRGQLGADSTADFIATPTPVAGDLRFSRIAAGKYHTCALTLDGSAYCWGFDNAGQVGDASTALIGTTVPPDYIRRAPVPVAGGLQFLEVTAGVLHSCALTSAGAAYCWGSDSEGQVGVERTSCPNIGCTTPIAVQAGPSFTRIVAGGNTTCALTAANEAYCWGYNNLGSVGDGTNTSRYAPTRVIR